MKFCGMQIGGGLDMRELDADRLLVHGCGGLSLGLLFRHAPRLHRFGFAEQDSAEAGDFFLGDVFGVGLLLRWSDE